MRILFIFFLTINFNEGAILRSCGKCRVHWKPVRESGIFYNKSYCKKPCLPTEIHRVYLANNLGNLIGVDFIDACSCQKSFH
ncbi:Oidioi.mRNA.OKI2018_I69.PAR.g9022.t1.cds [Oikopleura dioica]|uniref:Oidioi.mRNA.OKI2018_I69.PAR.g9022.t1.cds n=1 Tax=Oikopleura dioica TaxID=34765 RepID=A0ABN7RPL6_OIKDI|nr:Oidioi.mRNA.OKI2018_I69.PAR.g9022.t1.cds [Oikopleura dioica]